MIHLKKDKEYTILDIKNNIKHKGIFKGKEKWNNEYLYMFLIKIDKEEILAY